MDRWEYRSLKCKGVEIEQELAPWGEQGWEVVTFVACEHTSSETKTSSGGSAGGWSVTKWAATEYRALLKRRKS